MNTGAAWRFDLIQACRSGLVLYSIVLSEAGGENDGSSDISERSLFQMHFLEWTDLYLDSNFTEVCSPGMITGIISSLVQVVAWCQTAEIFNNTSKQNWVNKEFYSHDKLKSFTFKWLTFYPDLKFTGSINSMISWETDDDTPLGQWCIIYASQALLRPSDAYMRRGAKPSLVQICRLVGAKPLSEPVLEYC